MSYPAIIVGDETKDLVTDRSSHIPSAGDDVVDILHGIPVPDPYRWLEDADSPETRAWVEAQNVLTRGALDGPSRDALVERLTRHFNYPRTRAPGAAARAISSRTTRDCRTRPSCSCRTVSIWKARVLLDPNALSADGTTALTGWFPSGDGALVAYALSGGGSDRQTINVRDMESTIDRPDRLEWVKFASVAWLPDGQGFYLAIS